MSALVLRDARVNVEYVNGRWWLCAWIEYTDIARVLISERQALLILERYEAEKARG